MHFTFVSPSCNTGFYLRLYNSNVQDSRGDTFASDCSSGGGARFKKDINKFLKNNSC